METKKEELKRKIKDAEEKLATTDIDYEKFSKLQNERDRLKKRIAQLTKMLSRI